MGTAQIQRETTLPVRPTPEACVGGQCSPLMPPDQPKDSGRQHVEPNSLFHDIALLSTALSTLWKKLLQSKKNKFEVIKHTRDFQIIQPFHRVSRVMFSLTQENLVKDI